MFTVDLCIKLKSHFNGKGWSLRWDPLPVEPFFLDKVGPEVEERLLTCDPLINAQHVPWDACMVHLKPVLDWAG